jgi:circadian clock protein KaiC
VQNANHTEYVKSWLDQAAKNADPPALILLFEAAWDALWRRAESAVGEIALESIAHLARSNSVEKYPFLAPLTLEKNSVSGKGLLESPDGLEKPKLQEGLGFMLVEFLTVIGDLTDQILTPGLYAELSRITPGSEIVKERPEKRAVLEKTEEKMTGTKHLIKTGIPNFDALLGGGLVAGSSIAVAGPPGSGKTILAQQIAFHHATPETPVLFFSTLSEPGAKTLFYLNKFSYFDAKKLDQCVHFVDLGVLLRAKSLAQTLEIILERLKKIKPAIVVIDSFKVFEDMTTSSEDLRKFSYRLVVDLMTRKCTTLFLGEFEKNDYERNPIFSIIDGLVAMTQRELSGENQRFIQIIKMRGAAHVRDEHAFRITEDGIEVFAPRLTINRNVSAEPKGAEAPHCHVGIPKLDDLLGGGIPRGSSLLIAGVAGTGKTVLGLEFIYRGAKAGEKGIVFSFEETDARLRAEALGLGWDLDAEIERGMVKIVFIPQPDIRVEYHLLMIQKEISAMGAARVAVDSVSVFMHKVEDPQDVREKIFQLATIIQNAGAVGFFATDIPYGSPLMSRFGVEETVVDGVIILSAVEEGMERQRYIEVYKLRNTDHLKGRHTMTIESGGIQIFPRYRPQSLNTPPPAKNFQRLSTGVAGLDKLLGSGLLERSVTLVSGSSGIGKSVLGLEFILEGASKKEPGLYVTLEEGPEELIANADALGLPLQKAVEEGLVEIVYLPPTHIRSTQLLAVLTDKIKKLKTKRLVLDSVTHIVAGLPQDDVRELLYDLVVRFKNLGVTCLFTLESDSIYSTDFGTERGLSPLADNVIMLRYSPVDGAVVSSVWVVKTRGSAHDKGLYSFTIGKGGLQIGTSVKMPAPAAVLQVETVGAGRRH